MRLNDKLDSVAENEYVQVAFPIPILDTFTYIVPEHLRGKVVPGSHITAFLGRRRLSGFVVGTEPRSELKSVRPIESLVRPEPAIDATTLELAGKVADYYLCPLGEILAAAYPAHADKGLRTQAKGEGAPGDETVAGAISGIEVGRRMGTVSGTTVGRRVAVSSKDFPRDHDMESDLATYFKPLLDASGRGAHRVFLLTLPDRVRERMYPFLVSQVRQAGGSVIFLVPEISASGDLVELLKERFGDEVALFHSRLKISERKAIWENTRSGMLRVLIGTRSAVFLPAQDLRLIVVEDEHAEPFKQEETPRYNARDVAIMRSRLAGIPLLLASATPSVESFWAVRQGEFELLGGAPLKATQPGINVVDMRNRENVIPQSEELSVPLISAMEKALEARKRVLLFLNRRGFHRWVQCQECGFLEVCPRCELPLIFHSDTKKMACHHCSHEMEAPSSCGKCGGTRFRYVGAGVEKVQTRLKRFFPDAKVARIDLDSARTRAEAVRIAGNFSGGELDILIGTTMVTKGLDLGEISLAGVIHAEAQLNLPDFRSGERAFQLLSDVVSLVGDTSGEVIIQTFNPDHHSVRAISQHEPGLFYEQELKEREELGYPPFSTLIDFHVSGPKEPQVVKVVKQMSTRVASVCDKAGEAIHVLGPSPAVPARLKGRFRWHMSMRGQARDDVVDAAKEILSEFGGKHEVAGVTISVDVDPVGS
ncbi:MAG: primosomal protein N' [Candidatus Eisenbacteria bacterium]|nr:primosomal protein N' [Candidatus Eisenbacteria bacterium]